MEITVTVPEEFAAQAVARGLTPKSFVETLIAEQARTTVTKADRGVELADLDSFFEEMAAHSGKVPLLSDEALTRESFYRDHD